MSWDIPLSNAVNGNQHTNQNYQNHQNNNNNSHRFMNASDAQNVSSISFAPCTHQDQYTNAMTRPDNLTKNNTMKQLPSKSSKLESSLSGFTSALLSHHVDNNRIDDSNKQTQPQSFKHQQQLNPSSQLYQPQESLKQQSSAQIQCVVGCAITKHTKNSQNTNQTQ